MFRLFRGWLLFNIVCGLNALADSSELKRYAENCARGYIDETFRATLSFNESSVPQEFDAVSDFTLESGVGKDVWLGDILTGCQKQWPEKKFCFLRLIRKFSPDGRILYDCKRNEDFIRAWTAARKSRAIEYRTVSHLGPLSNALSHAAVLNEDVGAFTVDVKGDEVVVLIAPREIINSDICLLSLRIPDDMAVYMNRLRRDNDIYASHLCTYTNGFFYLFDDFTSQSFTMARALRHLSVETKVSKPMMEEVIDGGKVSAVQCRPCLPGGREVANAFERYLENCAAGEIDEDYRMSFEPQCNPGDDPLFDSVFYKDENIGTLDLSGMDRDSAIVAILRRCHDLGKRIRFAEMARQVSPSGKLLYSLRRNEDFERVSKTVMDGTTIVCSSDKGRSRQATTLLAAIKHIPARFPVEFWFVTTRGDTTFAVSAPFEIWKQNIDLSVATIRRDAAGFLDLQKFPTSLPGQSVGCACTNGVLYLIDWSCESVSARLFELFTGR